jgi:eukaryotic-like serine/threonine-protein kinase
MLAPGTVVDAKYRLERVLGRGGMGMVIEARHVQLGTPVALKFLHRGIVGNLSVTERFFREARATAAMTSEHVCRVFDVGQFDGLPYLVMERLEGTDLARLLRHRLRLPVHEACDYVIQACAGLVEAHAAKIVHRDLKPGNLFLTSRADGTSLVKVLDFGIAKAPQDGESDLTGTNAVLGSPAYMSFEQLRSSKLVDTRSDIWSLGVILFEMVSGHRPFVGEGIADLALKIAMEPTPRLPEGPAVLDDIILCCLAREPSQRFPDVAALSRALAPLAGALSRGSSPDMLESSPSGVRALSQRSTVTHAPVTTTLSSGAIETTTPLRTLRLRASVIGVLAAATVAGALLALVVTRGDDDASSASPPHKLVTPANVAPANVAPANVAPMAPSPPVSSSALVSTPVIAPDAAVIAPAADSTIEMEATTAMPNKPVTSPPRATPKPKPRPPKPSTAELSKSRI